MRIDKYLEIIIRLLSDKLCILLFSLCLTTSCVPIKNKEMPNQNFKDHLENQYDSLTWDLDLLDFDKNFLTDKGLLPFKFGVFPVSKYEIFKKDGFKGIGSSGKFSKINEKDIYFNYFFINKSSLNDQILKEKDDEVFFLIGIFTEYIDTNLVNQISNMIVSRNHPDYIGQGTFKTKNDLINYMAFKTYEGSSYAVVNMKLFDLKYGNTILINPKQDSTFRYLQIKQTELFSTNDIDKVINKLVEDKNILKFSDS